MKPEEEDPEFEIDDDEDGTPDYYVCFCCNHSCANRPSWGGQCPKCGAIMQEGYF